MEALQNIINTKRHLAWSKFSSSLTWLPGKESYQNEMKIILSPCFLDSLQQNDNVQTFQCNIRQVLNKGITCHSYWKRKKEQNNKYN